MGGGIHIGKLFGININVDWSWIFIFLLVTWNLAAGVFPQLHPTWSFGMVLLISAIASLLFFASVLAHEMAHSLVAVARGLPVRSITLFLFGGVSNIQREPPSPETEFIMAIVGPLTSIILGVVFIVLAGVSGGSRLILAFRNPVAALAGLGPLPTMLLWLGPINIILGVFNLIPGFPLDGGRVLRSILWGITGNLRQATRYATWVGQLIAWAFIIAGISMFFGVNIPFFGTGFLSGLWLAFIGWFLNNAATQSYRQVVVQDMLEGIPVSRLMRANPDTVPPDLTVDHLVDHYIMGTDERSFLVMQDDQLLGVVGLEDVRKIPRDQWTSTIVRQIMTPRDKLDVVSPREDAAEALDTFNRHDVRQLPVIQNGQLVGVLRRGDIMRWLHLQSDFPAKSNFRSQ